MTSPPQAAPRAQSVPLMQKIGYAFGGMVDGTALHPLNVFLLFYVTSVCGMPAGLAGIAIAAGLVVDAIADPIIGSASDRTRSRWGRRLPFMFAAVLPVALSFTLIFSLPAGWPQWALFTWLCALSIGLRMSVALFLLPHQALGAELSDQYGERSTIMGLRWTMFIVGGVLGVILGFGVFFPGTNGLTDRSQYTPFALSLSALIVFGGLVACRSALATRRREHPPVRRTAQTANLVAEVGEVFKSASFRILFGGCVLFFIGFGVNSVLGLHANTFFWRLTSGQTQLVTLSLFGGLLLGAPLAVPALKVFEKRTVLMACITGLLIAQATPVTLKLLGILAIDGQDLATLLASTGVFTGALMGAAYIAGSSAMADAADEHEDRFGARREGLYFAGLAFANKAAAAVGTLLAGFVLQSMDFPAKLVRTEGLSVTLPQSTVDMLGLAYGPGSALLSLAAVLTYMTYKIDRRAHAAIIARLDEKRLGRNSSGPAGHR